MAKIVQEITVDQAKALVAWDKLTKGMTKAEKKAAQITVATKQVTKENAKLERQAVRTFERSKTAGQRYRDTLRGLNLAVKKGTLNERQRAQAIRMVKTEMREVAAAGRGAFGGQALSSIRSITSALGLVGGVAGAVQLVRGEYTALIEVQQRAKETSLEAGNTEIRMLRNLGAETAKQRDESKAAVAKIARELRIPESAVEVAVSTALSARGALSVERAIAATRPALQIAPESPAVAAALTGAALDIGKQGAGITPESAIGFTLDFIQKARIVETEKAAIALPRATQAAVLRGDTPRTGAALLAALTQSVVDPEGRQSVTAALQVIEQLAKPRLVKETKGTSEDVKKANRAMKRLASAPGLLGALDLLRGDEEAREIFLERSSFQQKAKASVELLISGGRVRQDVEQFRKELPKAAEAGPIFQRKLAIQRGTPLQQTAEFQRTIEAAQERIVRGDPVAARVGILREGLGPLLESAGGARMATVLANLNTTLSGLQSGLNAFEGRIRALEDPRNLAIDPMGLAVSVARPRTAAEETQLEVLRELATVLREMINQNQKPTLGKPGVQPTNTSDTGDL